MMNWILMILLMGIGTSDFNSKISQQLSGTWKLKITGGNISQPQNFENITLEMEQEDSVITGTYMNPDLSQKGKIEGTIKGSDITFTRTFYVPSEENTYKEKYTGTIDDSKNMSGGLRLYLENGEPLGAPMKWEAEKIDDSKSANDR